MHTLARLRPTCSRETLELLLALMLAGMLGLALGLIGGLSTKYQLAFVIGGVLVGVLMLAPERRIWCMALWVMIQPLSIEKVFYVNAIYPDFVPQAVVFNAGDALLLMMAGFMLLESVFTGRKVWHWPRFATLLGLHAWQWRRSVLRLLGRRRRVAIEQLERARLPALARRVRDELVAMFAAALASPDGAEREHRAHGRDRW